MNYELEIQQSKPITFNNLNGDRPPLVAGSGSATRLTSVVNTTFPLFNRGHEKRPFSLEIWYLPLTNTGELIVLGHSTEGVIFNGTDFILRVKYLDGTVLEQTYTPPELKSFHIVMIFDGLAFTLWVDGVNVAAVEAVASELNSVGAGVSINSGTGTGIYDSLALYYRSLPASEIQDHYTWGHDTPSSVSLASAGGATTYELTYRSVNLSQTIRYDSSNWREGLIDNLSDEGTLLGLTGGGSWKVAVPIESIAIPTAGFHVTYLGNGVTLEYSSDGTAWTVIDNKTTILEDASPAGLYVRLTLVEDGFVEYINFDVLASRTILPAAGPRSMTFKGAALDQTPGLQNEYQADQGAQLKGGYVEAQPDTSTTPVNIQTIEAWIKVDDADGWLLGISGAQYVSVVSNSYTFAGMTAYRNGQPVANGILPSGEWAHYVFVLSSSSNTPVRFGQKIAGTDPLNMSVGHIALYPGTRTAAQALALYNQSVGSPLLRVDDNVTVTVTESDPSVEFYAYDWSVS